MEQHDSPCRPDAIIFLTNTIRPAWQAVRAGIPIRVGIGKRFLVRVLLTKSLRPIAPMSPSILQGAKAPSDWIGPTTVEVYLRTVQAALGELGLPVPDIQASDRATCLHPDDRAIASAQTWLRDHGIDPHDPGILRIGFQAGAAYGSAKRWPSDRLAETLRALLMEHPEAVAIGLGSSSEVPDLSAVRDRISAGSLSSALARRVIIPTHSLDLPGFTALVKLMNLVIANDSGPMHVAVAVGTPCVSAFGPTDWISTGYPDTDRYRLVREPGIECSPCMKRHCPIDHRCMTRIPTERMIEAARSLLHQDNRLASNALVP
jgi:ADP-heptose:LPS heptosyltransferase